MKSVALVFSLALGAVAIGVLGRFLNGNSKPHILLGAHTCCYGLLTLFHYLASAADEEMVVPFLAPSYLVLTYIHWRELRERSGGGGPPAPAIPSGLIAADLTPEAPAAPEPQLEFDLCCQA